MRHNPEFRLSPRQRGRVVGGIIWLGITAVGLGVGNQIDAVNDRNEREAAVAYVDELVADEARVDEAAHSFNRAKNAIPEACGVFLTRYLSGNELGGAEKANVDRAVDDALREPGQPCGDSASDVRLDVTRLESQNFALQTAQTELRNTESKLTDLEEKADHDSGDGVFWLLTVSAVGGAILGTYVGSEVSWRSQ
jgi:hypothetical protein